MILVDTSVWIDHFRRGNRRLKKMLNDGLVLSHPHVIGELACGNLSNRGEILALLGSLPVARQADNVEVMHFVDTNHLYAKGLGWIDMHLLASALLTHSSLWTLDKRLRAVAEDLKVSS